MLNESRDNRFARSLFNGLPARYDALAEILSFGQNRRWRAAMVRAVADGLDGRESTSAALDVATGTGGVALALTERGVGRVVGIDLTEGMLRRGKEKMETVGAFGAREPIDLLVGRAEQLPFQDSTFNALSFTYLLRYVADPAATLAEMARVVRPGGVVASLEFHEPTNAVCNRLWWLYTRMVLPVGGLLLGGPEWFRVGRFLGPSISEHYRRYGDAWTLDAWREAGLTQLESRVMSLGGGVVTWGRRGAPPGRQDVGVDNTRRAWTLSGSEAGIRG